MKGRRFLYCLMLFVLVIMAATMSKSASSASYSLTILHTSDLYGRIHPRRDANLGGVMWLSGLIAEQRQQASGPVLLLDSGDMYQTDFDASYISKGEAMIAFFNAAGYDAWVPGNHDFDWGKDNIARLAQQTNFPTLGANIIQVSDGKTWEAVKPYTIKEFDGFTVAILGLVSSGTPQKTKPEGLSGLEFQDPIAIAQEVVPELRRQADLVIVLSHLYDEAQVALAEQVPGIDIIVGGADHRPSLSPKYIGNTLLVNAGRYATHLGRLKLLIDPNVDVFNLDDSNILLEVIPNQGTPDPEVEAALKPYLDEVKPIGDEVVGYLDEDLSTSPPELGGTLGGQLGYFITDAMLAHESSCGEASIAWYNWAGLRDRLYAGAVTYRDLFNVAPFRDELVYLTISGKQIRELMEPIKEEVDGEDKILMAGRILSNEGQNWHASYPNEVQLEAEQQYRLVTIQFIKQQLEQQEKLTTNLSICEDGQDGILDEVLADYFRSQDTSSSSEELSLDEEQEVWANLLGSDSTIDGFGIASPHLRVGTPGLSEALDAQQKMGIRWAREEILWELVEPVKGEWQWNGSFEPQPFAPKVVYDYHQLLDELEQRDIEMLALLTYGASYLDGDPNNNYHVDSDELVAMWEDYVREVVKQFGDRIDYWEIGNEMNSRGFWGKVVIERSQNQDDKAEPDPALYAKMLKFAYDEIKAHDPNDYVVLGGLIVLTENDCPTNPFEYLHQLQREGAWGYFDAIAIHPYWGANQPEAFIERGLAHDPTSGACEPNAKAEYNLIGEMRALRDLADRFGSKPIWITEMGWAQEWLETWASYRPTEANLVEADYLVRTYVPLLSEPGIEKVFWYTQVDDPNEIKNNEGKKFKLDPPGQQALGNISTLLTGSTPLGQVQGQNDRGGAEDDDVYEYRFSKDNQLIIVIWKARGGDEKREVTITNLDVETIRSYNIDATDLSPEAGDELTVQEGKVTIQLTERPIFLVAEVPNWWEWSIEWPEWPEWLGWPDFSEWQKGVQEWWQRQQEEWAKRFEAWQKQIERQIEEQIKKQIEELVKGICGAGMLPFGIVLVGGVLLQRRKRSD